jgi:malate dehydrogenase (oxaloacetate-decarboxylating)(NADP+)
VPDSVSALYGLTNVKFGPEYLIPFPFDPRALLRVAPAVAWAAVASGVAKEFIDLDEYRDRLEARQGRARGIMRGLISRAQQDPRRVVFPEGEDPKILRAAQILVDEQIAQPILLGRLDRVRQLADEMGIPLDGIVLEEPAASKHRDRYAQLLWQKRQRKGMSLVEANQRITRATPSAR